MSSRSRPNGLGYRAAAAFQFVISRTLLCLLLALTNGSRGDSASGDFDTDVTVTRLDDGDDITFADPRTCPVDSRSTRDKCVCKCRFQFTWRQDLGKCVQSSDCDYTVMDGDYVPAMKIQSKNEPLLPDTHALRRGRTILDISNGLQIKEVYILGKNLWEKAEGGLDFGLLREQRRNVLKVKSKTDEIEDYSGTVVKFTLKKGNDVGCLMVKIQGNLTYNAVDFKPPVHPTVHPTVTGYPHTKPAGGVGVSTATGTFYPHSSLLPTTSTVATIPQSRVATSSPSHSFSSLPSVGGSTMIHASGTVTTVLPRSTEGPDQTVTTALARSTEGPDQTVTTAMPRSTEGSDQTDTTAMFISTESPDQTVTNALPRSTEGPDQTVTTAMPRSTEGPVATANTIAKPSLSPVTVIVGDASALNQQDKEINVAAIAGGIVAGLAVLTLIVVIVVVIYRQNMANRSVKIGEHTFGSTLTNSMYCPVADSDPKAINLDNPFYGGQETVPNTEATTAADEAYEEPAGILPTPVSAGQADEVYEEPLVMAERRDESVPVISNGYTSLSMIPQADQPPSVDQTYTGLVGDSLYEEIATTATSTE